MATGYSMGELLSFLDYEREKGLVKDATISARKAAVNAIFGILDEEEALDLREIDLESVVSRFANLNSTKFTPDSLRTYKSRASSALSDFLAYRENPIVFKPGITARTSRRSRPENQNDSKRDREPVFASNANNQVSGITFPIPIRPDLTVKIVGLPSDLTKREASKIAKVVMAMAPEDDEAE
jgi:hypothetical protein